MDSAESIGTIIKNMPLHLLREVLLEREDLVDVTFFTAKEAEDMATYLGDKDGTKDVSSVHKPSCQRF